MPYTRLGKPFTCVSLEPLWTLAELWHKQDCQLQGVPTRTQSRQLQLQGTSLSSALTPQPPGDDLPAPAHDD